MSMKLASLVIAGAAFAAVVSATAPAASAPTEWVVCMKHADRVCSTLHPDDPAAYDQCMYNREVSVCAGLPGDPNG